MRPFSALRYESRRVDSFCSHAAASKTCWSNLARRATTNFIFRWNKTTKSSSIHKHTKGSGPEARRHRTNELLNYCHSRGHEQCALAHFSAVEATREKKQCVETKQSSWHLNSVFHESWRGKSSHRQLHAKKAWEKAVGGFSPWLASNTHKHRRLKMIMRETMKDFAWRGRFRKNFIDFFLQLVLISEFRGKSDCFLWLLRLRREEFLVLNLQAFFLLRIKFLQRSLAVASARLNSKSSLKTIVDLKRLTSEGWPFDFYSFIFVLCEAGWGFREENKINFHPIHTTTMTLQRKGQVSERRKKTLK